MISTDGRCTTTALWPLLRQLDHQWQLQAMRGLPRDMHTRLAAAILDVLRWYAEYRERRL